MVESSATGRGEGVSLRDVPGAVARKRTYTNLLYIFLAFPLALLYWMFVGMGLVIGVVLLVLVVGIGILFVTLVGVRYIARFERWLANALLTVEIGNPDDRSAPESTWATIRGYIDAPSTWRALGYVTVKFWIGLVGLLLVVFLGRALELLTAPLRYPVTIEFGTVNERPVTWTISTLPEAFLAVPLGVVLGVIVLNVSNGVAYVAERIAESLLV